MDPKYYYLIRALIAFIAIIPLIILFFQKILPKLFLPIFSLKDLNVEFLIKPPNLCKIEEEPKYLVLRCSLVIFNNQKKINNIFNPKFIIKDKNNKLISNHIVIINNSLKSDEFNNNTLNPLETKTYYLEIHYILPDNLIFKNRIKLYLYYDVTMKKRIVKTYLCDIKEYSYNCNKIVINS